MKNWNAFYKKNFGILTDLPSKRLKEDGKLKLAIPPLSLQQEFFVRTKIFLGQKTDMFVEDKSYLKWLEWKLVLSPYTVGISFLRDIKVTKRPKEGYYILVKDSKEISKKTMSSPLADMEDRLEKQEVGLTFFEYLVLHVLRPKADSLYTNVALNSRLSDGKIICFGKNQGFKIINIFALPVNYKENNSQGTRGGIILPI